MYVGEELPENESTECKIDTFGEIEPWPKVATIVNFVVFYVCYTYLLAFATHNLWRYIIKQKKYKGSGCSLVLFYFFTFMVIIFRLTSSTIDLVTFVDSRILAARISMLASMMKLNMGEAQVLTMTELNLILKKTLINEDQTVKPVSFKTKVLIFSLILLITDIPIILFFIYYGGKNKESGDPRNIIFS